MPSPNAQSSILSEIEQHTRGAEFCRADLHIHSYGEHGSYDVKDTKMTVENIVDVSCQENLQIISITDHNSIDNVNSAINYGQRKGLLVIPGVELSTPNGHLLIYCPTIRQLSGFFGRLTISPRDLTMLHGGEG